MSTAALPRPAEAAYAPPAVGPVALTLTAALALLAGLAPLQLSIVAVFLFAGPHNWLEARYFLSRMPARLGKLRPYFVTAFAGVLGLSAAFVVLAGGPEPWGLDWEAWAVVNGCVQTALILWVAWLAHARSRTNPRRDWGWVLPVALLLAAFAWTCPMLWAVALVYLHPLMAFWLLDRELRRGRPEWRPALRLVLMSLPAFLGLLWWLHSQSPEPGGTLGTRIADHAGAAALQGVPAAFLVSAHAFLEMLHYAVWVFVMPAVGLKSAPWGLTGVPLAWRGSRWRWILGTGLLAGAFLMLVLWAGLLIDYPTARSAYFTVAIVHVLAEIPFLIRSL
jgi:hypothetical protein